MGRPIKKGSTDQSIVIFIMDSTTGAPETGVDYNTSGIDLWYRRQGATKTSITEATLAALDSAHSDGGVEPISDGFYRLDLPDAACASAAGVNEVTVGGTITGMIVVGDTFPLVAYDPYDAVRMGMTALPNAAADAAGGLPISDAGALDLDVKLAATNEVTAARMGALTDLIDGGRLDLLIDAIKVMTDKVGTITNTGGTATIGAILGDFANSALAGRVSDARMGALTDWINGGRLDLILDIIAADTTTDIPATLTTIAGYLDTEIAAILTDTNELQTDLVNGGRLDLLIDAIKAKTDSLTFTVAGDVDCNVQSWAGAAAPAMTGDAFARLGAPSGASVSADVASVKSDSAAILADTGELQTNQGAWATATGFSTHSAGDVWGVATRALTDKADFALSSASRDAIWDQASGITLSFEALLSRAYEILAHKMTVTDATGIVALLGTDNATPIATGSVTDNSTTTTRLELTWV